MYVILPFVISLLAPPGGAIDWANHTYSINDGRYTLQDGEMERPDAEDEGIRESLTLGKALAVDLDGDGQTEHVVALQYWGGGTGRFDELHVYRVAGGKALFAGRIPGGDRADGGHGVVQLDGERVVIERLAAMPWQGVCCPTFTVIESWRWSEGRMVREMSRSRMAVEVDGRAPPSYDEALAAGRKAMAGAERNPQTAIEHLMAAVAARPGDATAIGELGFAMMVEKAPQAEDVLWAAVNAKGPAKARAAALYNLARMYRDAGETAKARDAAQRSLVLRPGNGPTEKLLAGLGTP